MLRVRGRRGARVTILQGGGGGGGEESRNDNSDSGRKSQILISNIIRAVISVCARRCGRMLRISKRKERRGAFRWIRTRVGPIGASVLRRRAWSLHGKPARIEDIFRDSLLFIAHRSRSLHFSRQREQCHVRADRFIYAAIVNVFYCGRITE